MPIDPIIEKADHVTSAGDAFYAGDFHIDGNPHYVYFCHDQDLEPGNIYVAEDRSYAGVIIRRATCQEFLDNVDPRMPTQFLDLPKCHFFVLSVD